MAPGVLETEDYGRGPPLVLIHGSPANGKTWKAVGETLSDRFRVIAPTLPDHEIDGGGAPTPMTTREMAASVERTIAGLAPPIRLAAHSFGSNVALNIALGGRVSIDRLVLFEPVTMKILDAAGEDEAYTHARSTFDQYVECFRAGEPRAVGTMVDFWFGPGAFEGMPAFIQDYMIERTAVNVRDVNANFAETYALDALAAFRVPVTIAVGDASPAITRTIARTMARALGNASLEVIDGATHAMLISHPRQVAAVIGAPA